MLKFFLFIITIVGLIFFHIKYLESRSIFFPDKGLEMTPAGVGLSFEDVYLNTADNKNIHGWFIPYNNARYTLLFFHGNGGNIAHRLGKILILRRAKINIFIIGYRGYGKSSGKPSEKGIYIDAKAAYDYLVNKINTDPADIILYGESIGGAVAVDLAYRVKTGALITEGAFSRGKDIGKIIYPYIPKFILPNLFDSLGKIEKIDIPKLFIHAIDDDTVPFNLGKKLYNAASGPKQFVEITGGHNHAFIDSEEKYILAIIDFIDRLRQ